MREWNNPLNPFNSMKVLAWWDHLKACSEDNYLPPVTVDTDPSNRCNYKCIWCNAYDIINCSQQDMREEHLLKLADFYKDWGVKSTCVAGGGEPLMNKGTLPFLEKLYTNGLEYGLITNGSLLNDESIKIIARTARWVGFSIDAGTPETYYKVKGIKADNFFNKVIENFKKMSKEIIAVGRRNDLCYKFLLHPYNMNEIYQSAKLAKEIGARDFHLRPVGWENLTVIGNTKLNWKNTIEIIDKQIEMAMELECSTFRVYGIRHKFNPDFTPKKNFKRCWAIPILPTFSADGNVYLCFDMRGRKDTIMCRHDPDPTELLKFWNSEKHKEMVRTIDINKCPRCTFSIYNQIIEQAVIDDGMCINFP